jgi:hypothetical protein
MTKGGDAVLPAIVGTVAYVMPFDNQIRQTGFVWHVGKKTTVPNVCEAIHIDEGDVPPSEIALTRGSSVTWIKIAQNNAASAARRHTARLPTPEPPFL